MLFERYGTGKCGAVPSSKNAHGWAAVALENGQSQHRCQASYFQRAGPSSLARITKMSSTPLVSPGTRFEAVEVKARTLPSGVNA